MADKRNDCKDDDDSTATAHFRTAGLVFYFLMFIHSILSEVIKSLHLRRDFAFPFRQLLWSNN